MVGRDALSNTSGECVVAKANEADCFANAEVEKPKRERGGKSNLKYATYTFAKEVQTWEEVGIYP